jgi:hypothetical protein
MLTLIAEEFLKSQSTDHMNWSVISSGPYIEGLSEFYNPELIDGVQVWKLPLGDGAMPFIHLEDLGQYALWIFTHPEESRGWNLEIATIHASGSDIAAAYTAFTGKPARYEPTEMNEALEKTYAGLPKGADTLIGVGHVPGDPTLLTWRENFTAWWEIYRASGENKGIIQRDYELLDRIFPGRVKSVEEWMRKVNYTGEYQKWLRGI